MKKPCKYCKNTEVKNVLECLKGLFGGYPHVGVCISKCIYSESGASPELSILKKVSSLSGALTKEVIGIVKGREKLSSDEIRRRWELCEGCCFWKSGRCLKCGCFMRVKVSFRTSKCSIGKW